MTRAQFYSNNGLNRAVELRETIGHKTNIQFIPMVDEKFFFVKSDGASIVLLTTPNELILLSEKKYFLGVVNNEEVWCIDLSEIDPSTLNKFLKDVSLFDVRDAFPFITKEESSILGFAKGIVNWNNTHQFCNSCGSKTILEEKGHRRKCEMCKKLHFPRIDPAVIVLIEHKVENEPSLCLLNLYETNRGVMCSLFSGFSEIGESLEDTVIREMKEEVNLNVENIIYFASQPWSFPSSMMLGFTAESKSKNFIVDNKEIKKAQWFSAIQIEEMVLNNKLLISRKDSISNHMIESWVKQNK